ncbi:MAG: methyltransferase family protein [Alphaproteobacteria bacterium]
MHIALFLFYVLFFAVAFVWPTWRLWRRDGVNALVLPRDDSPHGFVGNWFRLLLLMLFAGLAAVAFGLPTELLGPLTWLQVEVMSRLGWAVLLLSLGWIVLAQRQMGRSWRIGIDTQAQPPLVTTGLFAISRNPIFLGMRVNLLGLLLAFPNAMTLSACLLGEVLMQVQVRLEEQHLEGELGEAYQAYRSKTRRWI